MGRTILGICVALLLSAALVASPCAVCFKQPPVKAAHDCCQKKNQAPPRTCGLEFSELRALDIPAAKVLAAPAVAIVSATLEEPSPAFSVSLVARLEPVYTPPPRFLLDSSFLI